MFRKMVGSLLITLILFWGGSAMALAPTANPCNLTNAVHHLTFPFFPATGDFWAGFGIANLDPNDDQSLIPADQICFFGRTTTGQQIETLGSEFFPETGSFRNGIPANAVYSVTMSTLATANPLWLQRTFMGVYTATVDSNGNPVLFQTTSPNLLRGFGLMGDGTAAQGYLALNRGSDNEENPGMMVDAGPPNHRYAPLGNRVLNFDYIPRNLGWPTGLAIANATGETAQVTFHVYYEDGGATPAVQYNKQITPWNMLVGTIESLFPGHNLEKRSRIIAVSDRNIHGYAFFSDGKQAQGLIPVYSDMVGLQPPWRN